MRRLGGHLLSRRACAVLTGLLAISTGMIYITFDVIEAEARAWGLCAVLAGFLALASAGLPARNRVLAAVGLAGYGLLLVAQLLPIYLWLVLAPVTDSPEGSVGTRLYVVPHLLLVVLSFLTMLKIYQEATAMRR